jgi:hypothetical protein
MVAFESHRPNLGGLLPSAASDEPAAPPAGTPNFFHQQSIDGAWFNPPVGRPAAGLGSSG